MTSITTLSDEDFYDGVNCFLAPVKMYHCGFPECLNRKGFATEADVKQHYRRFHKIKKKNGNVNDSNVPLYQVGLVHSPPREDIVVESDQQPTKKARKDMSNPDSIMRLIEAVFELFQNDFPFLKSVIKEMISKCEVSSVSHGDLQQMLLGMLMKRKRPDDTVNEVPSWLSKLDKDIEEDTIAFHDRFGGFDESEKEFLVFLEVVNDQTKLERMFAFAHLFSRMAKRKALDVEMRNIIDND